MNQNGRAAEAGADRIKFQTFSTASKISRFAPKADYQLESTDPADSQFDMFKKLELSRDTHFVLKEKCKEYDIGFFSTAFDTMSSDLMHELGVQWVKVRSGGITNLPLIGHMTQPPKPGCQAGFQRRQDDRNLVASAN